MAMHLSVYQMACAEENAFRGFRLVFEIFPGQMATLLQDATGVSTNWPTERKCRQPRMNQPAFAAARRRPRHNRARSPGCEVNPFHSTVPAPGGQSPDSSGMRSGGTYRPNVRFCLSSISIRHAIGQPTAAGFRRGGERSTNGGSLILCGRLTMLQENSPALDPGIPAGATPGASGTA